MAILLKLIYRFSALPIKIPMAFCADMEMPISKFMWNCKETQIAETILKKKNKVGGFTFPDFNIDHKATVIKTMWWWHKDRHINPWNRTESPEINQDMYVQLIFNKDAKIIQWGKNSYFQQVVLGQLDIHMKRIKLFPISCHIQKFTQNELKTFIQELKLYNS